MHRLPALFLLLILVWAPTRAHAAPEAELWPRWEPHDPTSTLTVDHSMWDKWLATYVREDPDGINRVNYAGVTAADRGALDGYIDQLQATPVARLSRATQQAYWINFYNAGTVQVILDHWPVESIRDIDISPGFFADGPWGKKLFTVDGEAVSLDDIEHRILRPIWQDPRIHYAVNCASIGCPNLATEAFTADNTDALMDAGAVAYINHLRGAQVTNGKLIVSSIYEWFKADFGGNDAGVIDHLKRFADPELKAALGDTSKIADDDYDWSINAAK